MIFFQHVGPLLALLGTLPTLAASASPKPRIIAITDVVTPDVEPDDMQSLVHLLASADMLQIDAIICSTGWNLDGSLQPSHIHDAINAYEADLPNLMKRSGQTSFLANETNQEIGYWPSAAHLRSVVADGQTRRGMAGIGDGKDTAGSRLVTDVVDRADPHGRPVQISLWGSGNTLSQALWDIRQRRSAEALASFLAKIRAFAITDQDRAYAPVSDWTGLSGSSHVWMRSTFGPALAFIWSEAGWRELGDQTRARWSRYANNSNGVQGRGALGRAYPTYKWTVEGDSSAWLHAWPGVGDANDPSKWSFGGRYVAVARSPDGVSGAYMDIGNDAARSEAVAMRVVDDVMNDFIARIDWAANGRGNRNPTVAIQGDKSFSIIKVNAAVGQKVSISAAGTTDPDGNALAYSWSQDTGAAGKGWSATVSLTGASSQNVSLTVPSGATGREIHLMVRVVDNGIPPLATWRRAVVAVSN